MFGGTFDPVHLGHVTVAMDAAEQIGAEKIVFVPAKRSPLKGFFPRAGDQDRLAMIALAIVDNRRFEVSDYELNKPAPSYTLDTVRRFQDDYGSETAVYWLTGADSVNELALWYKITELIDECNVSVMYRAGFEPPDFTRFTAIWGPSRVEKMQRNVIQTPLIDISSTEIRARLADGRDAADMLHPSVADYIRRHRLYQTESRP